MNMTDAYENAAHIDGGDAYPARWAVRAEAFRRTARAELDLPYGEGEREQFDIFHPDRMARGCVVFVHGGYWRRFDKSYWSHLAAGPLANGWAVAMPSYDLAPQATISAISHQVSTALRVIADRVPGELRLVGHSAGGHLVARMLDPRLNRRLIDRIAHVMPISPLSDLEPLLETEMNDDLGLDEIEAGMESPVHQPPPATPVTVWVGADERPAFLDQARWLAEAWECGHVVAEGRHHFDVIDDLEDPDSRMVRLLVG